MIKRDRSMNAEVIGYIITGMSELNKYDLSSDDSSMASLQDQAQENLSSNSNTDSYGDDVMYDDGEWWGFMAQTLKQIIDGTHSGIFLANNPTLYVFCLYGCTKVNVNSVQQR